MSLLFLNWKAVNTRSNWFCWKAQEKFQVEFRFWQCNPANKNMYKVSKWNSKKMCQLISKMILRKPERRHLTILYFAI